MSGPRRKMRISIHSCSALLWMLMSGGGSISAPAGIISSMNRDSMVVPDSGSGMRISRISLLSCPYKISGEADDFICFEK